MSEIEKIVGRNEPCPCGNGKKYKRCHGINAAPKLTAPARSHEGGTGAVGAPGAIPPGMENMDPAAMAQVSQALQRLPKSQLQRLQGIMQKAMSGKDVSQEAAEFERTLPPDFQNLMQGLAATMGGMGGGMSGAALPTASSSDDDLSVEEARKIVEKAAAEGKISTDQASELLAAANSEQKSGFGKLWGKVTGKK